jgi:hypothetical protein
VAGSFLPREVRCLGMGYSCVIDRKAGVFRVRLLAKWQR